MKILKRFCTAVLALLSFFTTVLCMKDVLGVQKELQQEQNKG